MRLSPKYQSSAFSMTSGPDWGGILCIIGIVAALLVGVFFLVDYAAGKQSDPETVMVVNREYRPPYTSTRVVTTTDDDGHTRTKVVTDHHSAEYRVVVSGSAGVETVSVSSGAYPLFVIDKPCTRWKRTGWMTGWKYGGGITPITVPLTPER